MRIATHKIKCEAPANAADAIAGLSPRELRPQLGKVEAAAHEAEQTLDRRKRELTELDGRVAALPAEIQAGRVAASKLTEMLRARDAAALLIAPAEQAL